MIWIVLKNTKKGNICFLLKKVYAKVCQLWELSEVICDVNSFSEGKWIQFLVLLIDIKLHTSQKKQQPKMHTWPTVQSFCNSFIGNMWDNRISFVSCHATYIKHQFVHFVVQRNFDGKRRVNHFDLATSGY